MGFKILYSFVLITLSDFGIKINRKLFNMKRVICLCFLALTLVSCQKDSISPGSGTSGFLKITINSKNYENTFDENGFVAHVGFDNQTLCDKKMGFLENITDQPLDSRFTANTDILFYRNNTDFKNSKPGTYTISKYGVDLYKTYCNLNFNISLEDNNSSGNKSTAFVTGTHAVTAITFLNTKSNYSEYLVAGQFTASFKNSENVTIPLTGSYQKIIQVFN